MIQIKQLTKSYEVKDGRQYVLKNVNITFPEDVNIGIIGPNGAGKSTFLRILGGIDHPDTGQIISNKSFSWPLGLKGGFVGHMTGRENCRMVCNMYGLPRQVIKSKLEQIATLADIGPYFEEPVKYYSSGMGGRLGFALSMAFDFDYFLIDEITSVGDAKFKKLAKEALEKKAKNSRVIMVSHSMGDLKKFCDVAVLIKDGQLKVFNDIDEAIGQYDSDKKTVPQKKLATTDSIPQSIEQDLEILESELQTIDAKQKLPEYDHLFKNIQLLFSIAELFNQIGAKSKALEYYEKVIQLDPKHIGARLKIMNLCLMKGNEKSYKKHLEIVSGQAPENLHVFLERIRNSIRNNDFIEALNIAEIAQLYYRENHLIPHLRAQALQKLERLDEAISAELEAISLAPKKANLYPDLSRLYSLKDDLRNAQKAQLTAIRLKNSANKQEAPSFTRQKETLLRIKETLTETPLSS